VWGLLLSCETGKVWGPDPSLTRGIKWSYAIEITLGVVRGRGALKRGGSSSGSGEKMVCVGAKGTTMGGGGVVLGIGRKGGNWRGGWVCNVPWVTETKIRLKIIGSLERGVGGPNLPRTGGGG